MLSKIKAFFEEHIQVEENTALSDEQRRLACAALLIEVACIDQEFDQNELEVLQQVLIHSFSVPKSDCAALTELARQEFDQAVSTYQFTRLVNDHCDHQEKFALIEGMWQVAYADGNLDKYEEHVIRKVSDLLHLPHSDFIRAKHLAAQKRLS